MARTGRATIRGRKSTPKLSKKKTIRSSRSRKSAGRARVVSSKEYFAKYGKVAIKGQSVKEFKKVKAKVKPRPKTSLYIKGVVSRRILPSIRKVTSEAKKRTSKIKTLNKQVEISKPLFDFGKLWSPFSKVKGLVGGADDKEPITEKVGGFISGIFDKVKETGQTAYESVTAPVTKTIQSKQKFDVIVKIIGIVAAVFTVLTILKKR